MTNFIRSNLFKRLTCFAIGAFSCSFEASSIPKPGSWSEFARGCYEQFLGGSPLPTSHLEFSPLPPLHIIYHARSLGMLHDYGPQEGDLFWRNFKFNLGNFYNKQNYSPLDYLKEISIRKETYKLSDEAFRLLEWIANNNLRLVFSWDAASHDIQITKIRNGTFKVSLNPALTIYSTNVVANAINVLALLKELNQLIVNSEPPVYTLGMTYE